MNREEFKGKIIFQANSTEPHSVRRSVLGFDEEEMERILAECDDLEFVPVEIADQLLGHGHALIGIRDGNNKNTAQRIIRRLRAIWRDEFGGADDDVRWRFDPLPCDDITMLLRIVLIIIIYITKKGTAIVFFFACMVKRISLPPRIMPIVSVCLCRQGDRMGVLCLGHQRRCSHQHHRAERPALQSSAHRDAAR